MLVFLTSNCEYLQVPSDSNIKWWCISIKTKCEFIRFISDWIMWLQTGFKAGSSVLGHVGIFRKGGLARESESSGVDSEVS